MDVIAPEIRLDLRNGHVRFEPSEWTRAPGPPTPPVMHHEPTHAAFVILFDGEKAQAETLTLADITARLSHVCDGHAVPHGAELVSLGRAAIAAFLVEVGAWPGSIVEV